MKTPITIIFLLLFTNAYCQNFNFERDSSGKLIDSPAFKITKDNHLAYYERAKRLVTFDNQDSLYLADNIFCDLNYFDKKIYSKRRIKKYTDQMIAKNMSYCKKAVVGSWYFVWRGSNWGTSYNIDSFANTRILFTDKELLLFKSDSLVRRTTYKIKNEADYPFSYTSVFQLLLQDNHAIWNFQLSTSGSRYFANITFSEENLGLCFNEMPGCVCGCPEVIYLRNKPSLLSHK